MKKLPISILLFCLIYLSSCTKEGPAGPAGPQGPAGPAGSNGTANIQNKTVTINPSDWQWNSSQLAYFVDVPFSAINSNVLTNGAVVGYLDGSFDNVNGWFALPFTKYPISGSSVYTTYEITVISLGSCRIRLIWSDGRQTLPSSRTFRIVAIGN